MSATELVRHRHRRRRHGRRQPGRGARARLDVRVALIEAVPHDAAAQPSFDERTTALSNGSRRILETLGVWPAVAAAATPDRARFTSRIRAISALRASMRRSRACAAMGYVVPNRALGAALWSRSRERRDLRVYCPAQVSRVDAAASESVELGVAEAPGRESSIKARLVVAADGVAVRGAQRLRRRRPRCATTSRPRSSPRCCRNAFTSTWPTSASPPSGPLALLPLERRPLHPGPDAAAGRWRESAMSWSDEEFLAEVQRRFGFRLGRFLKVGRRVAYPLSLTPRHAHQRGTLRHHRQRGAGTASGRRHGIQSGSARCGEPRRTHRRARRAHRSAVRDFGRARCLSAYDAWRAADRGGVIAFTDGLVRLFSQSLGRGAAAAQSRAAGLRFAAAREGGVVVA